MRKGVKLTLISLYGERFGLNSLCRASLFTAANDFQSLQANF